ncbi:MAG TPA: 30S ribosomal protein S17 [Blastocatellia bacterium]|nr:30S ribosomal protein S17 [Blastocatellia bacterium]
MEENLEKTESASESENDSGSVNTPAASAADQPDVKAIDTQSESDSTAPGAPPRHRRQEKVGLVTSDKMQKTVVVRVERQVKHRKYKRYIRRRTKFMAHDEMGAHIGDIVRIVETRPLSARKRWRVVEIVQKSR